MSTYRWDESEHESFAATEVRRAFQRLVHACDMAIKAGFDSSQPRVSAGNSEGGQWTSGGGGTSTGLDNAAGNNISSPRSREPKVLREIKPSWRGESNELLRDYIANQEQPHANTLPDYAYGNHHKDKTGGALGRYQIRTGGLLDLGLKIGDKDRSWRKDTLFYKTYKISSDTEFLKTPDAQEDVMTAYMALQERYVAVYLSGYENYRYRGIQGEMIAVTQAGLVAASHRAGAGVVRQYLEYVKARGGTVGLTADQLNRINNNKGIYGPIETRLRGAQNIPYHPTLWPSSIPGSSKK